MITFDLKSGFFHSSLITTTHGFGTKSVGDGRNDETRKQISKISSKRIIITPSQVHSTNIKIINDLESIPTEIKNTDGVITTLKDIILTVVTADCVPIIFEDLQKGIIGISHQGWKGIINELPSKMIEELELLGSDRDNILCAIGPSINSCCYKVDKDRLCIFEQKFGKNVIDQNLSSVNLLKANYELLRQSNIKKSHISFFPFCTSCNDSNFWSFRRDNGIRGEMISYIIL